MQQLTSSTTTMKFVDLKAQKEKNKKIADYSEKALPDETEDPSNTETKKKKKKKRKSKKSKAQ